jgi:peroxiredoxin
MLRRRMAEKREVRVAQALADAEVLDAHGRRSRLGERWRERPALVVFLRHFACIACTEHVAMLSPRLTEIARLGIAVVFVGNGAPNFIEGFVERNALAGMPCEIVTDPSLRAFDAAGLERSRWSSIGPQALRNLARALLSGYRQTRIEGAGQQQGGVMLVEPGGGLAYVHRDRVTGDHAPTADVVDAALALAARGAAIA